MPEDSTSVDDARSFSGLNLPIMRQPSFMKNVNTEGLSYMGLPYHGAVLPFKKDDPHYQQPQYHTNVHVEQLETTNAEHMKKWTEISQKVSEGLAVISFEERQYDQALAGWRILIRWFEPHYDAPQERPLA